MLPLAAVGLGISAAQKLAGLFGHHHNSLSYHPLAPFSYMPDPNDPEIGLRRSQILLENARQHGTNVNEVARAGLLGSSAGLNEIQQGDTAGNTALEGVNADVYTKRRLEALDTYNRELDFQHQLGLGQQAQGFREHNMALEGLSSIGEFGGQSLEEYLRKRKLANLMNSPELQDYKNADMSSNADQWYQWPQLRN